MEKPNHQIIEEEQISNYQEIEDYIGKLLYWGFRDGYKYTERDIIESIQYEFNVNVPATVVRKIIN